MYQLLVKPAKRDEIFAPPGAQIDRVYGSSVVGSPRFCATRAEARTERCRDRALAERTSLRQPRPAHAGRPSLFKRIDALCDIIFGISCVHIHSNHDVATGNPESRVEARGRNSAGIGHNFHARLLCKPRPEQIGSPVVAFSISDQDIQVELGRLLLCESTKEPIDMADLVAARTNDGYNHWAPGSRAHAVLALWRLQYRPRKLQPHACHFQKADHTGP